MAFSLSMAVAPTRVALVEVRCGDFSGGGGVSHRPIVRKRSKLKGI